ncbi:RusA family crossover junction endodeoxyribonuclease, partial [Brenneria populi subsp. brevivirga]|uniref:RusA family crossover junction endodeoxyribonuclease n=1 Tax=Brenneria populi TaxID=1505588 RepID=UPI002E172715|nr:RusA family crossover junction endodeoxyribonuclease [Brenneria populi subsp. brevivirga]
MKLTLPFPPSVNTYWRSPGRGPLAGRHLISARGREFRTHSIACVLEQLRRKPKPIMDPVSVSLVLYPPDRRQRDMDNYLKATLDAITHSGLWG